MRNPRDPNPNILDRNEILQTWQFKSDEPLLSVTWILVTFAVLAVAIFAVKAWQKWRTRPSTEGLAKLAIRAGTVGGLPTTDTGLLTRIAQQQQLASPLTLMISEGALAEYGRRYVATLPAHSRHAAERRLRAIRSQLFAAA